MAALGQPFLRLVNGVKNILTVGAKPTSIKLT